jgi:hypothetical protein
VRTGERFRDVELPPGMAKWVSPTFDDRAWRSGRAPIGVGVFKAHGHGRGWTATPDHSFKNHADWGTGEFILMRTTFAMQDLDGDHLYSIRILSDQGYHVYLNGHKIHTFPWFSHFPQYERIILGPDEARHLKQGVNTLAVYSTVRFELDDARVAHPIGQVDVSLEGLKKSELGITR